MSHPRGRMPGEFDSRKDSHSTKVEQRPQIFVKLSFRDLSDCSGTQTHNHLVCKRTLNNLAKWLSVCFQTKSLRV